MRNKGSVLMISLWILAILVIFAVALGHRAAINLKVAKYQRDNLRAYYLAKAGVNLAIAELSKKENANGTLDEPWHDNPKVFERISFGGNENEFAAVSYLYNDGFNTEEKFGLVDEERKLNLNGANEKLITALLSAKNIETPAEIATAIIDWLNPNTKTAAAKKGPLKTTEELIPILENFYAQQYPQDFRQRAQGAFEAIKNMITVYPENKTKVNINTVSEEVLRILAESKDADTGRCATISKEIIALRDDRLKKNQPFFSAGDMDINLTKIDQGEAKNVRLFNDLKDACIFKSDLFCIESTGNIGKTKRRVAAIYNRKNNEIAYWHQ